MSHALGKLNFLQPSFILKYLLISAVGNSKEENSRFLSPGNLRALGKDSQIQS